jgi:hypothetical protein
MNARGQQVFSTAVSGAKVVNVPAGSIAKGIYFVELENGTANQRIRCIVK